jgi:ABC-type glutathione transport system ATPase component
MLAERTPVGLVYPSAWSPRSVPNQRRWRSHARIPRSSGRHAADGTPPSGFAYCRTTPGVAQAVDFRARWTSACSGFGRGTRGGRAGHGGCVILRQEAFVTSPSHASRNSGRDVPLRLRGVSKTFGKVSAVKPVDLEIYKGDFFAILGPSGCGKTTLLRIIGGPSARPGARAEFSPPSRGRARRSRRRSTVDGATPPVAPSRVAAARCSSPSVSRPVGSFF